MFYNGSIVEAGSWKENIHLSGGVGWGEGTIGIPSGEKGLSKSMGGVKARGVFGQQQDVGMRLSLTVTFRSPVPTLPLTSWMPSDELTLLASVSSSVKWSSQPWPLCVAD